MPFSICFSPTVAPAQVGTLTSPPPSLCDLDELPPLPAAFHSHICIPPPPTPLLLEVPPFLGRCWIVNSFRWTFLSNLEHSRVPRVLGVFAKEAPSLASSECPRRMDLQLFPAGNCSVMLLLLPVTLLPHLTSLLPSSCVLWSPPPPNKCKHILVSGSASGEAQ